MRFLFAIVAVAVLAMPQVAEANSIRTACNASDRNATRGLCQCIGAVADATLTRRQIREGARWFADPQRAQDTRQSDRSADERMWLAWRAFVEQVELTCG